MDPLPHQIVGAEFLAKKKYALLADEMRVGKSVATVIALERINAKKVLVVCPATARINWLKEFDRWGLFGWKGTAVLSASDCYLPDSTDVVTCSYNLILNPEVFNTLIRWNPTVVVFDESHYLKELTSQRSKLTLGKKGIIHVVKRAWFLSGTPSPNHAGELYPTLYTTGQYPYSYDTFIRNFCTGYWDGYEFKVTGSKNQKILREKYLDGFMLRRTMAEVLPELPPIHFVDVTIEPAEVDMERWFGAQLYTQYEKDMWLENMRAQENLVRAVLKQDIPADQKARALTALGDSTSSWRRYTGLAKVTHFAEMLIEDLHAGMEKAVVFAYHRDVILALRELLKPFNPVILWGGTPAAKRQKNLDKFQSKPQCRVFIGQIIAAKENIDLTAAKDIYILEPSWVPGDNVQAAMRCRNVLQKQPVTVRFIHLSDSTDEAVQRTLRRKTEEITKIYE